MAKQLDKPTIINQREYISINFGNNRRLTTSYSGEKAAGDVPLHVFNAWIKMVDDFRKNKSEGKDFLSTIQSFANNIATIWPEWNIPPRAFKIGESVVYDFGPKRGGMDKGVITKVARTITIRWERSGLIGMAADMLAKYNKG